MGTISSENELREAIAELLARFEPLMILVRTLAASAQEFNEQVDIRDRLQQVVDRLMIVPAGEGELAKGERLQQIEETHSEVQKQNAKIDELYRPFRQGSDDVRLMIAATNDILDCLPVDPPALLDIRAEIERLPLWTAARVSFPPVLRMRDAAFDLPKIKLRLFDLLKYLPQRNPAPAPGGSAQAAGGVGATPSKPEEGRRTRNIPFERKMAATRAKEGGATNKQCAAIVYDTRYPSPQQVKSVSTIMRYFRKTHPTQRPTRG